MAEPPADITFCLIVPSGAWNLAALGAAIRRHHDSVSLVAVWCGDPHLRPLLDESLGLHWADLDLDAPQQIGWGLLLTGLEPRTYEWCRTSAAVARLLTRGATAVVVVRVGSMAVLGSCRTLASMNAAVVLVPRTDAALPADGLAPGEDDLIRCGRFSSSIAVFRAEARAALEWIGEQTITSAEPIGPLITRMSELFGAQTAGRDAFVAGWTTAAECDGAALVDLEDVRRDEPWHLEFGDRPARIRLSTDPSLAEIVRRSIPQLEGESSTIYLPGGVAVDTALQAVVSRALRRWRSGDEPALPPEPFGSRHSAFVEWLEGSDSWTADIGRYWMQLRLVRPDLQTIYPQPYSLDAARFVEWIEKSWQLEDDRSVLLRANTGASTPIVSVGRDPSGVNVLGYFDFDQSQGHIARRLVSALEAAGVPVAPLNHHRSQGSRRPVPLAAAREARFATNVVVVNADQLEFVVADHGGTLLEDRRTIAYWFWELEHVPERFRHAIDHVDEIWTGSQFIADAFSAVTDKPVRCVPLPVTEPQPSNRDRASMGLPDDAYVFVTTFDQFSVPERKNPFGSIEAFTRAFADGEGPVLMIKTVNGERGWRNHERLLLAASGRRDIIVWDEHLSRGDQMAVLANADCLVSLHRSEGLGLHCAEAMWLAKPVIATRYSGNLDFMDDTVAAMIDFTYVKVKNGEGIYPDTAIWADPDLDQAATWMRRLVDAPQLGVDLGRRARQRMQAQPSLADTGRLIARLADLRLNPAQVVDSR